MRQRAKKRGLWCVMVAMVLTGSLAGAAEERTGPEQQGAAHQQQAEKWDTAGREVKKASEAVTEATKETAGSAWDKLQEESSRLLDTAEKKSKTVWEETKQQSKELWIRGKASIHEATAPEPPAAPQKPTSTTPVSPGEPDKPASTPSAH